MIYHATIAIPIYLPRWLAGPLRTVRNKLRGERAAKNTEKPGSGTTHPVINLLGDRDVEWSWIASQIPPGPGEALDFGHGGTYLGLMAAQRGFNVTAVDLQSTDQPYKHASLSFIQGDLLELPFPPGKFDLVINCSTVEHVGLAGRYGVTKFLADGDFRAMSRLRDAMKPGGVMLLTVPVGQDAVFAPLCRVYGDERLPRLLDGYILEKETFWVKDRENRWSCSDKKTALAFEASAGSWDPFQNVYALGCFVLVTPARKPAERGGNGDVGGLRHPADLRA